MATVILVTKTISDIQDVNRLLDDVITAVPKVEGGVKIGDNILRLQVSSALDIPEDATVDGVISGFVDSDPEQKVPYIYDLVKPGAKKHFHSIDYKNELVQSLIPKRTAVQGEVVKVEWFQTLDGNNNPTNKVLLVDVVYTRDNTGFAISRTTTRTWINRDGSENPDTKTTSKYYFINSVDQIQEGIKRRKLLVDNIQIPVLGLVMESLIPLGYTQESCLLKGRQFMDDYDQEFNKFVQNSSTVTDPADPDVGMKTIRVKVRDEANPNHVLWLDKAPGSLGGATTIRQYLLAEFDI